MTNKELLDKYAEFLSARGRSKAYHNYIRLWLSYMEENKIETITQEIITGFFITNAKYKDGTKCMFIKAGRSFYTEFLQVPKEQNEFFKIKLIKTGYKIPDFLSSSEVEEAKKYLITNHSKKMTPIKIRALLSFLFATGIRKAELLNLKRIDFDMENNRCKVFGKGKKERLVYFNNKVKKEVEDYFISENEDINAFSISIGKLHYFVKLMSKYLDKKVYLHLIRHSSARNMVMKDIPINIISKILGHSSTQSTLRYIDPSEQMISDKYQEKMK